MIVVALMAFIILPCFLFKQKTAYDMRISDWSSDVCSSDIEVDTTIGRRPDDRSLGFLGIGGGFPEQPNVRAGFVRTFTEAGSTTATFLGETVTSLGSFFTGGISDFASTVIEGGNTEPSGPTVGSGGSGGAASSASVDDSGQNRLVSILGVARIGASMGDDEISDFLILMADRKSTRLNSSH